MLSVRHTDSQNHHGLAFRTPAKQSTSNTVGLNTILRTTLKENTTNRVALLKSTNRPVLMPVTPGLGKPAAGPSALKPSISVAPNTTKGLRLLDTTNKSRLLNGLPESPTGNAFGGSPLKTRSNNGGQVPETVLRPSQARVSLRKPRISGGSTFPGPLPPVTPAPEGRGKHWEVGDVSVDEPSIELEEAPVQDLDDEIEYMPPPVTELPYDPGFDMPDYKEIGAAIWKIGNIFDLNIIASSRPPEQPFEFDPADTTPAALDSLLPPPENEEPYVPEDLDVGTFIGSKNLYARFEMPVPSTSKASAPSPSPKSPLSSSTSSARSRTRNVAPAVAGKKPTAAPAKKTAAKAGSSVVPAVRRIAHERAPSRSTLASSLATVRPTPASGVPSATRSSSRTPVPIKPSPAAAANTRAGKTAPVTKRPSPAISSAARTTGTAKKPVGAAAGKRATPGQMLPPPAPVPVPEEELIEQDLMAPQAGLLDDLSFELLLPSESTTTTSSI
ncbi:hypothetical protein DL93DRAFT_2152629 [Clavulina sp. PMI_390]|nr:hypothetical protein DL93DRAFT_2152629 [Clavulina sp. PMI_390]